MNPVKVGVVGVGRLGAFHSQKYRRLAGCDLVAVADIDEKRAQKIAKPLGVPYLTDYRELFNEVEAVSIATPTSTHFEVGREFLKRGIHALIEKPLCTPSLEDTERLLKLKEDSGTFVAIGYNHTLTKHSLRAAELLAQDLIGRTITISAAFREYWGGIFGAHPWLAGPQDSYLGYWNRGGGAGGEHSHAVNIWQHFARLTGSGRVTEVMAMQDMVNDGTVDYDRIFLVNVRTEKGLVGSIIQDVVTEPPQKTARLQGEDGFLEWWVNWDSSHDSLRYAGKDGKITEELFSKSRPDDFAGEIDHLGSILDGKIPEFSPISLEYGMETMLVVSASYMSHRHGRKVRINYNAGPGPQALELE